MRTPLKIHCSMLQEEHCVSLTLFNANIFTACPLNQLCSLSKKLKCRESVERKLYYHTGLNIRITFLEIRFEKVTVMFYSKKF